MYFLDYPHIIEYLFLLFSTLSLSIALVTHFFYINLSVCCSWIFGVRGVHYIIWIVLVDIVPRKNLNNLLDI